MGTNKSGRNVASVHRFGERVAVYVGDGQTTYLSPKQAKKLACAKSCLTESFIKSQFGTVEIENEGEQP